MSWKVVILLFQISDILAITPCTNWDEIGRHDPKSKDNDVDGEIGVAILLDNDEYQFDCCGFIETWEICADSTAGSFDAQVWRQVAGNSYSLVGSNTLTPKDTYKNDEHDIANGNRIRVVDNDYIGLHSIGSSLVTHKNEGKAPARRKKTGVTSTMASPYDWSTTDIDDEYYAINAYVTPSVKPQFTDLSDVTFFNDEVTAGSTVKVMGTSDADLEDVSSLTVTLTSSTNSGLTYFEIATGSSTITSKSTPPVGTYTLQVKVEDPCTRSSTQSQNVIINNRIPVIYLLPATIWIAEDTAADTLLYTFHANDTVTNPLTCTMISGNTDAFELRSITGTSDFGVYTKNPGITFDYDVKKNYSPGFSCTDGDDAVTGQLKVKIIKNMPPVIGNLPNSTSFIEDLNTNTLLFTLDVTDGEGDAYTCVLNPTSTIFDVSLIAPSTTDYGIYLTGGTTLDYDTTSTYTLPVECSDHRRSSSSTFTVNLIRNVPPVIVSLPDSTSFLEDLNINTLLHSLAVTDNEGDTVTCTLNPISTIFDVSLIAPSTTDYGIYLTGGTTLDYDTTSSYTLTVDCSDVRRTVSGTFTVTLIRNTPPVINSLPNTTSISEDLNTLSLLHILNVTDVNPDDTITCHLLTNADTFQINLIPPSLADYGIFLKGGVYLDYDVTSSYTLTIICGDHRRNGTSQDFTVDVIMNQPPSILNLPMSAEIAESIQTETQLYTVLVSDPTSDIVTCTISSTTSIFYLQASSNQTQKHIYVRSGQSFNYETQKEYSLDITCADQRRNTSSTFYIYLIRNKEPYFNNLQGKANISAKASIGDVLFQVSGGDPDNDQVKYSMSSDVANVPFSIDQNTGDVTLVRTIRHEQVTGYELFVNISDGRDTVGPRTLSVFIQDINSQSSFENLPANVSVFEGTEVGSVIFQPSVTDYDILDTHTFFASFTPPDGAVYFELNVTTGSVLLKSNIDYETIPHKSFILSMTVSDSSMQETKQLSIAILNVNEAPRFTKSYYDITVAEGMAGTQLPTPTYEYVDEDGDSVTFSLNCGSHTGYFRVTKSSGILYYDQDYDMDLSGMPGVIYCTIDISDSEFSDTAYINITIEDSNDNTPSFGSPTYTFYVPLETSVSSQIGQIYATDDDIGTFGNVFYHIEQGSLNVGLFDVGSNGTITLKQSISGFVEGTILNMTVFAVDNGGLEDSALVYIVIPSTLTYTTVQNEIMYYTFFTHATNMAWLVPVIAVVFITVIVVAQTVYTGHCKCHPKRPRKKPKRVRRRRFQFQ